MSQRAFAKFLRVGEASVKRWEAGLIQDEANDQLIRLRTNLEAARRNVSELEQRSEPFVTVWTSEITVPLLRQPPRGVEWASSCRDRRCVHTAPIH